MRTNAARVWRLECERGFPPLLICPAHKRAVVLRPLLMPLSPREKILKVTCLLSGLTRAELLAPCRKPYFVTARQYAAVRLFDLGLSKLLIARALHRDQASVRNLLRRAGVAA